MAKIMIVEKDEDVSAQIRILLKKEGYGMLEVMDIEKIFSKIYSFRPDIILLGDSCREVESRLKHFEPTSHVPVICLPPAPLPAEELMVLVKESFQHNNHIA